MNLDIGHGPEDRRDRKLAYLHHLCDRHGQEVARQLSVAGLDLAESRAEFDALAQRVIRALDLSEAEAELENLSRIWPAVTYLGLDQSGVWQLPISQVSQWARLCRVVLRGFDGEETLTSIAETYAPNYFAKLSRGLDDLAH